MATCMICKKDVTAGFVVCGDCAHKLEPFTLPTDLAYFIDQLAESIVKDEAIYPCDICAIEKCTPGTSCTTCKNGVKAWLLSKAGEYLVAAGTFEKGE